ncbi:hypothetical protein PLESTB_000046100 [Pleodorina starrii]|uniref:Hydroxymethylglutaryl-CoA synthase n=1 Tax=Pleodorina starrii TaxID=330485 RepID=A0A9W6BA09_9CHLO|nr:hypothetical protein PLESTB_000046100 [Pleodorina starrii]
MAASWRHGEDPPRPDAVGILALDVYFPTQHVRMEDMEAADGCPGKYTQGLGQEAMSFASDREDAVSLALTVTQSLLEKYGVRPEEVGHVQVATESGVDRSKSIKSHIMTLFSQHEHGAQQQCKQQQQQCDSNASSNTISGTSSSSSNRRRRRPAAAGGPPAEGADCVHACYGGTAALLAAAAWVESRRWDGRLALVVAADVALYAPGSAARPTGGVGAAAFLVGPDAPLVLDPLWYGSHSEHAWDFYKPLGALPYPSVDGPQTLVQYLGAAGWCALRLAERLQAAGELALGEGLLPRVRHYVGHSPFSKLARKGLARVALMDVMRVARERERERAKERERERAKERERERAKESASAATAAAEEDNRDKQEEEPAPRPEVPEQAVAQAGPRTCSGRGSGDGAAGCSRCCEVNGRERGPGQGPGADRVRESGEQGRQQLSGGAAVGERQVSEAHEWVREWVQEEAGRREVGPGQATEPAAAAAGPSTDPGGGGATQRLAADLAPNGPEAPTALAAAAAAFATAAAAPGLPANGRSAAAAAAEVSPADEGPVACARRSPASDPVRSVGEAAAAAAAAALSYESYATWRLDDKALEAQLTASTAAEWSEKAGDGSWLQKQVGNSYTACLWQGLASLVWRRGAELAGRRVLLFSFGSGTIASLFSLVPRGCGCTTTSSSSSDGSSRESCGAGGATTGGVASLGKGPVGEVTDGRCEKATPDNPCSSRSSGSCDVLGGSGGVDCGGGGGGAAPVLSGGADGGPSDPRFTLAAMQAALNLEERLRRRAQRPLATFNALAAQVEASYACPVPYTPIGDVADVAPGAYYLVLVDEQSRRWYERKA